MPALADAVHNSTDATTPAASRFCDHHSSRRASCRSEVHPNLHRGGVSWTRGPVVNIDETKMARAQCGALLQHLRKM